MESKKFTVRIRAVIVHEDKLLVMRMHTNEFYALPGGKMEIGETILECLKREITEELGVYPKIGRLLFTNSFVEKNGDQSVEFIFEVTNGVDYLDEKNLKGTHSFEFNDICWFGKNDKRTILPKSFQDYLNSGSILSDTVRFL
jgi:ADP-ribose pyrophosphatase YjhB (NUDIX family)